MNWIGPASRWRFTPMKGGRGWQLFKVFRCKEEASNLGRNFIGGRGRQTSYVPVGRENQREVDAREYRGVLSF